MILLLKYSYKNLRENILHQYFINKIGNKNNNSRFSSFVFQHAEELPSLFYKKIFKKSCCRFFLGYWCKINTIIIFLFAFQPTVSATTSTLCTPPPPARCHSGSRECTTARRSCWQERGTTFSQKTKKNKNNNHFLFRSAHAHIADESDCSAFYHCQNAGIFGTVMTRKSCGRGLMFNIDSGDLHHPFSHTVLFSIF